MSPLPAASTAETPALDGSAAVVVVGEALLDLIQVQRSTLYESAPGGNPANVALGLGRLDIPVRLCARISGDTFGRRIAAHLGANGVDLSASIRADEPTSLAVAASDGGDGMEYAFWVNGTADWQWRDSELIDALGDQAVCVYVGSLAATMPPGDAAIFRFVERAREQATVIYDPNCRPSLMGAPDAVRDRIEALVAQADIVKASKDDLAWLMPDRDPIDAARDWCRLGPAIVAVTLGASGVTAVTRSGTVVQIPGRVVSVVDTVGAGDAFTSALLAELYRAALLGTARREDLRGISHGQLAGMLDVAVLASAITCTRRGADPPTQAELLVSQQRENDETDGVSTG
jgi:fructokinase